MSLTERNAVVTGGASGIGLAIVRRLARDGANVAVFDLDRKAAEAAVDEVRRLGRRGTACPVDVADRGQVDEAVRRVRSALGPILILVNNAGLSAFEPFTSIREDSWDRIMAVNLKGTFNCTQAIVGDMIDAGWGRIVNISSSAGQTGARAMVHYAASKAGMIGFTKALALELASIGITVNTIPPGFIDTPMLRQAKEDGVLDLGAIASASPMGRAGRPEEVAAACAFLASEDASYITGQVIGLNGGRVT